MTAEDLYQQGIALANESKWVEAAAKLEESNRLDRAPGTTINLANCYEQQGRLASAWSLFVEAATVFGRSSPADPRAETARARAEALYPRLSRLTIDVPESVRTTTGLVITRDGEAVGAPQFGTGIAVDAGTHVIEASAPGKKSWKAEVTVGADAARTSITVPLLVDATADRPRGTNEGGREVAAEPADGGWHWQKKAAVGAAGAGLAGVIVGAIFGVDAIGKHDQLAKACTPGTPRVCTADGVKIAGDEKTAATISTVGLVLGGAFVATGTVLWLTAPSTTSNSKTTGARIWVAPQFGLNMGLAAGAAW